MEVLKTKEGMGAFLKQAITMRMVIACSGFINKGG